MTTLSADAPVREAFPIGKDGFRLRGREMTRTETFTDAAFAFAVTLLVISVDSIPTSYTELRDALAGIPAFGASFILLWFFWYGHWQWSRRFGLEDVPTILLSFGLVFVMLSYVYPLKFLATLSIAWFSGRANEGFMLSSFQQLYDLFAIYGAGFVAMSLVIVALNAYAYRKRTELELDPRECFLVKSEIGAWLILATVGALSVLFAIMMEPSQLVAPGWTYMLLAVVMPIYGRATGRRAKRYGRG